MTMAATMAGMAIGGMGWQAYSQYRGGREQEKWYRYNAMLDLQQAKEERRATGYEAGLHRKAGRELLEEQRAGYAAAGVGEEGTPGIVAEKTAEEIEIDALAIQRAGKQRAQVSESRAKLSKLRGRSARRAGMWQTGTTLLTGAPSIYRTWFR